MLRERATQLDTEENSTGQPSIWREVYNLMRCPGPPCDLGPHCWRDPVGKRHYKLRTDHLRSLIRSVKQGHTLISHDDVPEDIRQQLYAEEQQKVNRKQLPTTQAVPGMTPITINNNFPDQYHPTPGLIASTRPSDIVHRNMVNSLGIPGHRDVAVKDYTEWQLLHVQDGLLKSEVRKACEAVLEDGLDLEQLHHDQDFGFLVDKGVKRGIARHFCGGH
jgi:hypothetical protein